MTALRKNSNPFFEKVAVCSEHFTTQAIFKQCLVSTKKQEKGKTRHFHRLIRALTVNFQTKTKMLGFTG